MSASLYWRPTNAGKCVGKRGLIDVLAKAFGIFPETLREGDIAVLEVAQRFAGKEIGEEVQELIDAIEVHKSIDLSVEY